METSAAPPRPAAAAPMALASPGPCATDPGAGKVELDRLALAGRRLKHALDLVELPGPNNLSAAWFQCEQAIEALGQSVDALTPAEWLVEASVKRLGRAKAP